VAVTFIRGEKVRCHLEVRDEDGVLTDPTSAAVSIYDPLGSKVITSAALSKDVTGIYNGSSTIASTWIRGRYRVVFEVVVPTSVNVYAEEQFDLEVLPE